MASIKVSLLATDRLVWQGQANTVVLRTLDGELGILAGHVPMLSSLAVGPVYITTEAGEKIAAAVHGGFVTVDHDEVTIFAQRCELKEEIDLARVNAALSGETDPERIKRNQVRLTVANG
jgi:F-type H+-transporting ATPase subunit epsilon